MSYAKKTEITFFRENRPDDQDLDGKNPRLRFFVKIYPTTMITRKIPKLHLFVKFDPTAMTNTKKTEVTFFRENWPDDHVLDGKNPRLYFS
jgi:UPF0288 family protein (methanogenesis marker protein 3)